MQGYIKVLMIYATNFLTLLRSKCVKLNSQFVRSIKARWEKLKQFSIIATKPISINSVSNSTNKLYFHCQTARTTLKVKTVRKRLNFLK